MFTYTHLVGTTKSIITNIYIYIYTRSSNFKSSTVIQYPTLQRHNRKHYQRWEYTDQHNGFLGLSPITS